MRQKLRGCSAANHCGALLFVDVPRLVKDAKIGGPVLERIYKAKTQKNPPRSEFDVRDSEPFSLLPIILLQYAFAGSEKMDLYLKQDLKTMPRDELVSFNPSIFKGAD
jgi:hypothetical protein